MNAALKSMASWRNELAEMNEKNGKRVIEQMATAAAALGWPEQVVDAVRIQLQSIGAIQIKTMDQLIDACEEQVNLPNPMSASTSAMLSKLKRLPALGSNRAAADPLQVWMQFAEQWQRAWGERLEFGARGIDPRQGGQILADQ
jgi:ribonuclease D